MLNQEQKFFEPQPRPHITNQLLITTDLVIRG